MFGSFFRSVLAAGFVATAIGGCSGEDLLGSDSSEVVGERTWKLSPDAVAAGKQVRIAYDAAPAWRGTAACSGKLREGAHTLGEYLADRYVAIDTVGGYSCRRNTADSSRMSVHGTGRALDLMIPQKGGGADSARGDIIANWLVQNATRIGVQLIIWNHTVWRANGTNTAAYGGPNPHTDHIHVEITNTAARMGTPWFASMNDEMDGGAADASMLVDGAADDDNGDAASPAMDAGAPKKDASAPPTPKDAGTSTVDASKPPTPTTDSGTDSPDDQPEMQGQEGTLPPDQADPGGSADGYDFEVPEGNESAPDDALDPKSKRRPPSVSSDPDAAQSSGCSAAPMSSSRTGTSLAIFAMLGIAIAITRRSKRS